MKTIANTLPKALLLMTLVVMIHHIPMMAQEKSGTTKLIIIKEHIDADGNKTVERIEREGEEAENFDMENFSNQPFSGPNIQWKKFDFNAEDFPQLDGFENFEGFEAMPDLSQFFDFEQFFGDEGGMRGFGNLSPFGLEEKPRLGVQIQSLESQEGVLIASIQPQSVAQEIGLKTGDIILAVDGESINEPDELVDIIRSHALGDKIALDILRDDKHLMFEAQLGTPKEKEIKTRKI